MTLAWHAALLSPPHTTLTYALPSGLDPAAWRPGQRVIAPLGSTLRVAVLLDPADPSSVPADIELKELVWPVDRAPLLTDLHLDMAKHLALRQLATPGRILASLLPLSLRSSSMTYVVYGAGRPQYVRPKELAVMDGKERAGLAQAWADGRMEARPRSGRSASRYLHVVKDPPWPVRPSAKRQILVLEHVWERQVVEMEALRRDLGPEAAAVAALLADRGLLAITAEPPAHWSGAACDPATDGALPPGPLPPLTKEQEAALAPLSRALDAALDRSAQGGPDDPAPAANDAWLVHGVTGSGKTRVYLELALKSLQRGRSVLLLAPEIALACKLMREAAHFFQAAPQGFALDPQRMALWHGSLPPAERERLFLELAASREPVLVAGTRSALFAPVAAPGLMVLDEEHDASFKQDERMTYQAKEVAFHLARRAGGLLVLGSATPDVKTRQAAENGQVSRVTLHGRVGGGELPEVKLVDIRGLNATDHILAQESLDLLAETVGAGDQAVIMLNRRGYAPLMYCLDCGRTLKCPECDIGLTYHKGRERLVCHYCGNAAPFPLPCPGCGGHEFLPMGEGTEKLEESLTRLLPPEAGILRLDRDSARRPGRMEEILAKFARGEAQVLVGTQMLSKGHHFPDVTLVIAADGDLGLNLPDYRAAERTFQLLVQVAGRAGRGDKPGRVRIQTRDPNNPCWKYVLAGDYEGFAASELEQRKRRGYPPFVKLGLVRMSFPLDYEPGMGCVADLARTVREHGKRLGVMVLGPAPAPLGLLRGRKRFHCLLKAPEWPPIREVFARARAGLPERGPLRLALDLDPVDML